MARQASLLSSPWRPMAVRVMYVLAVYVLLGAQAPDEPSLARIKSALQKPAPTLVIAVPGPEADFRVNIDAIRPFADIFEVPPWVTPTSDLAAPHVNCARARIPSTDATAWTRGSASTPSTRMITRSRFSERAPP